MAHKQGFLSKTFKTVAAASAAVALASSLSFGPAPVYAEQNDAATPEISYRHHTLASDSVAPVGVQLVLAMDSSGSMTNEEFSIQLEATAQALNSDVVRSVIKYKGGEQSIAVAVLDFDGRTAVRIPWVDIRGEQINDKPYLPGQPDSSPAPDKLDMLAQEIRTLPRLRTGGTEFEPMMRLSKALYLNSPWPVTERRILDVFSDGVETGYAAERKELVDLGVTINAFAILNESPEIYEQYQKNLVSSGFTAGPDGIYSEPGRVWAVARNLKDSNNQQPGLKSFFGEVTRGMRQKISVEVAGIDEYYRALAMLDKKPDFPVPDPS